MLERLPHEILLLILVRLNSRKNITSVLGSCRSLYGLGQNDLFWRDLVKQKYSLKYNIRGQTWRELYISGEASQMCPHLQNYSVKSLERKRSLLWSLVQQQNPLSTGPLYCCSNVHFDRYGLCMESDCEFIGCGDLFFEKDEANPGHLRTHHQQTQHNMMLKLSTLHYMELWCYSCNTLVGDCGFSHIEKPLPEKYMCRKILQFMTALPDNNPQRDAIIEKRRLIEQQLSSVFQHNSDLTYLIEKNWFTAWINFLIGKSNEIPGPLDNSGLFSPNDKKAKLKHDLIIGCDYELVSRNIRAYIERVYGLANESHIASRDDYIGQPLYRGISQSTLLLRRYI